MSKPRLTPNKLAKFIMLNQIEKPQAQVLQWGDKQIVIDAHGNILVNGRLQNMSEVMRHYERNKQTIKTKLSAEWY